ncbi:MAG: glycosyltransferase [Candidatus Omnitrophica bacterium]|nr:glycosyltransferase [Candidatus Omnitrophota bacterium]
MKEDSLSIIILNFNSKQYLGGCLDSIFSQDLDDIEVVVVDNGSEDNSEDFIRTRYPAVVLIRNQENRGTSFARNQAIDSTKGNFLLFMDADAYLQPGFLSGLKRILKDLPARIAGISPKVIEAETGRLFTCGLHISKIYRAYDIGRGKNGNSFLRPLVIDGPNTCCGVFRREALLRIKQRGQYFDEDFFFLFEDADVALRFKNIGYGCMFEPSLVSFHYGVSSPVSKQKRRYLCFRNRWYMVLKHNSQEKLFYFLLRSLFYDIPRCLHYLLTNKYALRSFRDIIKKSKSNLYQKGQTTEAKRLIIFNASSFVYGAERGLLNLIKALKDNYRMTVVLSSKGPLVEKIKKDWPGVEVMIFPMPVIMYSMSPLYYLVFVLLSVFNVTYFIFYVLYKRIDIICTNSLIILFPGLVAKFTRRRHVWFLREFFSFSILNRKLGRLVSFFASDIICQSGTIAARLGLNYKAKTIYEPLDQKNYVLGDAAFLKDKFNIPRNSRVISIVSRIHPSKGQLEFLKEIEPTLNRDKRLFLIIAGDISPSTLKTRLYKRKIDKLIEKNNLSNVFLLGFRSDVDRILSFSDICVFPFLRDEPFGIAVAEALAFNKITFFPKRGGLKEVYKLFKKGEDLSLEKIKEAISGLKEDSLPKIDRLSIPEALSFDNYKLKVFNLFRGLEDSSF